MLLRYLELRPPVYMGAQLQIIDTITHNIDNKEGGN